VQLRYPTELTFEQYVKAEAWHQASLEACPLCPPGQCRPARYGSYLRKIPAPARVARFYCPRTGTIMGLLPDFYASRLPGTLPALEEAVARAEQAPSLEAAANEIRPGDVDDAVTLPTAMRWVRLRLGLVHSTLTTVRGLFPSLFERCQSTVRSFRAQLETTNVLVALRGICQRYLHALPAPLGLLAPSGRPRRARRRHQQSIGPDPPGGPASLWGQPANGGTRVDPGGHP
jgi:hypothetical protein